MTTEPRKAWLDNDISNAWNKLKYACKDVGASRVKLEVEVGAFNRVIREALELAVKPLEEEIARLKILAGESKKEE